MLHANWASSECRLLPWGVRSSGEMIDSSKLWPGPAGEIWYQKEEPSGSWYVFRSDPPKPEDGFAKLKLGNQIRAQLEAALGIK